MWITLLLSVISLSTASKNAEKPPELQKVPADSDCNLDMIELVTKRGYTIESHFATTKDGYILNLFRIPKGKTTASNGIPVILQHGLLDSSYTWINNFDDESLGYILADEGYDVWFGNNRGNHYGRNHTTLDPDDGTDAFWDFTWDDMAFYDVPTMINYILDFTNKESISWIGHSEGTTQMFAAATSLALKENDEYFMKAMNSIDLFIALAPVAFLTNQRSKLVKVAAELGLADTLYDKGLYEFLPWTYGADFADDICRTIENGCDVALMTLCGPTQNINTTRIQVYVTETPAGTSIRNMQHWQQAALSEDFKMFDFGSAELNMEKYSSSTPPNYDLSQLAVPTALIFGENDYLGDPVDVKRLIDIAPSDKIVFIKEVEKFAHLDFTWGFNANQYVYNEVSSLLAKYGKK